MWEVSIEIPIKEYGDYYAWRESTCILSINTDNCTWTLTTPNGMGGYLVEKGLCY